MGKSYYVCFRMILFIGASIICSIIEWYEDILYLRKQFHSKQICQCFATEDVEMLVFIKI